MTRPSRRDWELIFGAVSQAQDGLEATGRAWVLGSAEDAVAVVVALRGADDDTGTGSSANVSLTLRCPVSAPLRLSAVPSELGAGSPDRPSRWCPDDRLLTQVSIQEPAEPVGLTAVRLEAARGPDGLLDAGRSLARGGCLVLLGASPDGRRGEGDCAGVGLRPADAEGRIWIKDDPVSLCSPAADDDPAKAVTLADHLTRMQFVESYRGLAYALAHRFGHRGESDADLEQVALLALVRAAKRFEPTYGADFASFATACILGELKRHFRDKAWMMRVPRSVKERFLVVKAAQEELVHILKASPSIPQIAEYIGVGTEDVIAAMEAGRDFSPMSLDAPVGVEGTSLEVADDKDDLDRNVSLMDLRHGLAALDPSERLLIERVYFQGRRQRDVARELGVSQMQVSRMVARTINKLRRCMSVAA